MSRDGFFRNDARPLGGLGREAAALRERLRRHVEVLAGLIGERHMNAGRSMEAAASYIERELGEIAGERVTRQRFAVGDDHADNVVLERAGVADRERMVIVGAHYDTVPTSPGADDNASAVAMLIETARLLAGRRPGRTVRFVAFANEEMPHHAMGTMGSEHYLEQCLRDRAGPRISAMICLEMVGYYLTGPNTQRVPVALPAVTRYALPRRGNFISAVANPRSAPLLVRFWRGFRRESRFPLLPLALPEQIRDIRRSDHRPFWDARLPALMITDTSYLRNPHYHMPSDTPDTLDYERMTRATVGVAGGIAATCGIRQPCVWM